MQKMSSKNVFFNLVNDAIFRKTKENVINHRDIRFITTETGTNY